MSVTQIDSRDGLHYRLGMQRPAPLEGLKVLDLCDQSGTYCGKLLADLGADVVLVEPPEGSPMRRIGPFHPAASRARHREASLFFWHFNANKRSIAIDLESRAGARSFLELATKSDLVIESFAPGYLDSRSLGYRALTQANPALVLTSITAFGQSGPYRDFRASDLIAQSVGGLPYVNGFEDAEPLQGFGLPAYHTAAIWAALGSLLALFDRLRTGRGQWVDVSLHASSVATLEHATTLYRSAGAIARRTGALHWTREFRSGPCRDGHIVHGLMGDWTTLAEWVSADLENDDLTGASWNAPAYRHEHHERLFSILDRWAADKPVESLAEAAQLRRLPYAAVEPFDALLSNPQVRARDYFLPVEYENPRVVIEQPAAPFRFGEGPRSSPRRAPRLGEHGREISTLFEHGSAEPPPPLSQSGPTLRGVRVVDFTWAVAGPLATRVLADHGAEVIKVERPGTPRAVDRPDLGVNLNRGKRSIAIDLATDRGVDLARALIAASDVVVDNFSPRVMANWGLDAQTLTKQQPRLISIGMSGFGDTGPFSRRVSYGPTLQAAAGHSLLMWQNASPAGWGFSYSDMVAGHMGAAAILTALWHRQRTGMGRRIDLSQFETLIAVSGPALLAMQTGRVEPPGNGSQEAEAAPHGIYRCADEAGERCGSDRWCAIAVFGDGDWQRLVRALGCPAWAENRRFATHASRRLLHTELDGLLSSWTRERRAEDVMSQLQAAGVAAGVVANARDLCERDPQLRHRGYWATLEVNDGRRFEVDGLPLVRSGEALRSVVGAPRVGEHTDAILSGLLGCDAHSIESLRRDGVVS